MKTCSCEVYSRMSGAAKCSIRKIAELLGISKSSTQRHMVAIKKRALYPESPLWETNEGYYRLRLLYFGATAFFVVHCGIGTEKLSTFFVFLRLNERIAASPSKIKEAAGQICGLLEAYRQEQEKKHQGGGPLKIVGGIDETYFKEMILVLMDLSSGYIFLEEASEDKSCETWLDKAKKAADRFNVEFKYVVSGRAEQLIKLAAQGFNSSSIPDLFHAGHELVKLFGINLKRKKAEIEKNYLWN